MARKTLTDRGVAALKTRSKLYHHADPQMPGHYVRVTPAGARSFAVMARDPNGKQVLQTIGRSPLLTIDKARARAREAISAIKAGADRAGPQSFQAEASDWFKRNAEAKGLRSAAAIRRALDKHILPEWGGREFTTIKRGDVANHLDTIEAGAGPGAADFALSVVGRVFNWYATRHDDYRTPLVKGMRRSSSKDRARSRILTDDEIRDVWQAATGTFGDLVKIRLVNDMDQDHPMHHPFHIHGAGRFLIVARDDVVESNLAWKDTVLVRSGETVDILLDVTSPGLWMAHCHIAEHNQAGMMFSFPVRES